MSLSQTVSILRAYPVVLTAIRRRETEDAPWGPIQFEMSYENRVEASLGENAAKLYAQFITKTLADQQPGAVVARDPARFAHLAPDGSAEMPEGYEAPLDMTLARAAIGARGRGEPAA